MKNIKIIHEKLTKEEMIKTYKYNYTYKITNKINGMLYIGVKSTDTEWNKDTYMGSSEYLNKAIKQHGRENFTKEIISYWDTRELANLHEEQLHEEVDVTNNELYYNKRNGNAQFMVSEESTAKQKATINDEHWKATTGKEQSKKMKATVNDEHWKATTGKEQSRKHSKTLNDEHWKATTGKESIIKRLKTISTQEWQDGIGAEGLKKQKATLNDEHWKATTGKKQMRKRHKTMSITNKDGLTKFEQVGVNATKTKRMTIDSDGLDSFERGTKKGVDTKKKDIINGLNGLERATIKMTDTRKKDIIDGLDSFERGTKKGVDTKKKDIINGLNNYERAGKKATQTALTNIDINGLNSFERGRIKSRHTKETLEWIEANTFICKYCKRTLKNKGGYIRWHGENCKLRS